MTVGRGVSKAVVVVAFVAAACSSSPPAAGPSSYRFTRAFTSTSEEGRERFRYTGSVDVERGLIHTIATGGSDRDPTEFVSTGNVVYARRDTGERDVWFKVQRWSGATGSREPLVFAGDVLMPRDEPTRFIDLLRASSNVVETRPGELADGTAAERVTLALNPRRYASLRVHPSRFWLGMMTGAVPVEVWVVDGLVRRLTFEATVEASFYGRWRWVVDTSFSDYGTPVDIQDPRDEPVIEAEPGDIEDLVASAV